MDALFSIMKSGRSVPDHSGSIYSFIVMIKGSGSPDVPDLSFYRHIDRKVRAK